MKYIFQKLILVVIFILKINSIECNRPPPWFMDDEFIYYIDIEQKYTSNYTQKECLRLQMIDAILNVNLDKLLPLLRQIYGDFPGLWTFKNDYLSNYLSINKCFVLDTHSRKPKDCSAKMGLICKKRMKFAYLYRGNSVERIEQRNIKKFCDPQAPSDLNSDLVGCLIQFNF